jgi:hypothetical protein
MINYLPYFLAQFQMFRSRLSGQTGSAVIGFALVFPLIAFIFISTTDVITRIVKRETVTSVSKKVLREGLRLPRTEDIQVLVHNALEQRGFDVNVKVLQTTQNTANLVQINILSVNPQFSAQIYGVFEREYE